MRGSSGGADSAKLTRRPAGWIHQFRPKSDLGFILSSTQPAELRMSTEATLARHLDAFTQGPDAIMRDYTDDSLLISPDSSLRGLAEIRPFFERFLADSPPELLAAMTIVRREVQGEIAYIVWKAEPFIPLATDTFLIRDDKIVTQTFAAFMPAPAASQAG